MESINIKKNMIAMSTYLTFIALNVQISKIIHCSNVLEWWINTFILYIFIIIFVVKSIKKVKLLYKVGIIISIWFIHAFLTIPAAFILGILIFDPNNIRTQGEHRAVFILASLPIFFYLMQKSKIFQKIK